MNSVKSHLDSGCVVEVKVKRFCRLDGLGRIFFLPSELGLLGWEEDELKINGEHTPVRIDLSQNSIVLSKWNPDVDKPTDGVSEDGNSVYFRCADNLRRIVLPQEFRDALKMTDHSSLAIVKDVKKCTLQISLVQTEKCQVCKKSAIQLMDVYDNLVCSQCMTSAFKLIKKAAEEDSPLVE